MQSRPQPIVTIDANSKSILGGVRQERLKPRIVVAPRLKFAHEAAPDLLSIGADRKCCIGGEAHRETRARRYAKAARARAGEQSRDRISE